MTTAPPQSAFARRGPIARLAFTCFFVMVHTFSSLVRTPWVLGEDGAGLLSTDPSGSTSGLARIES